MRCDAEQDEVKMSQNPEYCTEKLKVRNYIRPNLKGLSGFKVAINYMIELV